MIFTIPIWFIWVASVPIGVAVVAILIWMLTLAYIGFKLMEGKE